MRAVPMWAVPFILAEIGCGAWVAGIAWRAAGRGDVALFVAACLGISAASVLAWHMWRESK